VWVDIWYLLKEIINILKPQIESKKINIEYDYNALKNIQIWGERSKIKQVLMNIISNSIKYNKEHGTISIKYYTSQNIQDHEFTNTGTIQISDTGIGMDDTQLKNLFQPFNRLGREQSSTSGSGLGLCITKKIVDYHEWILNIDSKTGIGTIVRLNNVKCCTEDNNILDTNKTILYIEDNTDNCKLMRKIVNRWDNIELLTTPYGKTGINLAIHQKPVLILLDLNLPDISGADVLMQLRQKGITTPIYVISADNTQHTMAYIKSIGCDDYITKPIFVEEIIQLISKYI